MEEERFPWPPVTYRGKRFFDLVIASLLLIVSSPCLAIIALLIKITSRGPIIYHGRRMGFMGKEFSQLKFRTMTCGHEGGAFTVKADPRITKLGKVLRFFKLDEMPQLINVIRGDMSIVGPRPEDHETAIRHYSREHMRVLTVRPGLTCLLQVRIFPDFTYHVPENVDAEKYYLQTILPRRITEDLAYVDNLSFMLDLKIVLQTAWCILGKSWKILFQRLSGRNLAIEVKGAESVDKDLRRNGG